MEVPGKNQGGNDDTTTDVACDPCLLLKHNKNADQYCVDCDEFFCNNCSSAHRLFKVTRNHKLLCGDEMPKQKLLSTEKSVCSEHSGKKLKYYCEIHENFFCIVCVTLGHTNCPIEYIDNITQDFETSPEYRSLTEKISSLLQQLKDIKKTSTQNSHAIQSVYTQFVSDVKAFRLEINKLQDSMETTVLREALNVKEFDMKAVHSVSTACDTLTIDVDEIVTNLEKYKRYKQQRQFVISAKKAKTKICEMEREMDDISRQNKVRYYEFLKNEKVMLSLRSVYNLGTLLDIKNEAGKIEKKRVETENVNLVYKDSKCVTACYVGQINVKHSEDKCDCWITGSVMIAPYRIALTDWNNSSLKIVNVDSRILEYYLKLSTKPWDATCIDKNQIAIACENRVVFLKVGHTLTVTKGVKVIGNCCGIVFNDSQLILLFDTPEPAIKLMSLSGEIMKTFSTDQNGQPLFEDASCICLNRDKSMLFVSAWMTDTVTCLDLYGRVQNVYRDTNLKSPRGLTVDTHDNIYIAGCNSQNVHQISSQTRRILLDQTQGMKYPVSMIYCETVNRLYISHYIGCGLENLLSVYQLQ